ncbi:phospholipase D family protein [Geminicoccus harenae]|uniref:phospholipase D family protein n=1 Tax=Geminicoccus harenae TaxID=2498453 RepID=UPI002AC31E71|nr:phospholipase D family protein [Geminicoccus harenae]
MTSIRHIALRWAACLCAALLVASCSPLPTLDQRTTSTDLEDTETTWLGRAITPLVAAHPGKAGIHPLAGGHDAFAARMLLARRAERSLDVQYYIWRDDLTGTMLFEALHAAADRGVRVRLLLDDNGTSGIDAMLALLDSHPGIEVRLFNPFTFRPFRLLNYLTDFARLNRRMHNKSFTADNQATIIGGRNVGDEYFDAAEGVLFADLDVLAVGPIVADVSRDFDRYWASASSYPVDRLLPPAGPGQITELASAAAFIERDPAAAAYVEALRNSSLIGSLEEGRLPLHWARTRMVSDDPAKGLGQAPPEAHMFQQLQEIIGNPEETMDLVSPYFVPAEAGTAAFARMAARGVTIRVLTNSFEATDVAVVHAGYAKRRQALLQAGITLYEMRRLSPQPGPAEKGSGPLGSSGSSASSLHAKTFSVDGSRVYIGSFNFDPRSANLNTEMGFVIESPMLARQIAGAFDDSIPRRSYRVQRAETGELYWTETRAGETIRHDTEPGTSFWQRMALRFLSMLPIDWLL